MTRVGLLSSVLLVACGGDAPIEPEGDAGELPPRVDSGPESYGDPIPAGGGRFELIGDEWDVGPGTEGYLCVHRTIEEALFIKEIRPIDPEGTHHTVVTYMEDSSVPDESVPCSVANHGTHAIYGSGIGTEPFVMPEGVAIEVPAGAQVWLNLHLFNTGSERLTGHSGIEVVTVPESEVEHSAATVLAGEEFFTIPAHASDHWIEGGCRMKADTTLFALFPHMHQYGDFIRVTAVTAEGERLLHEDVYDFDDQRYRHVEPMMLRRGERVRVECRYQNPTSSAVRWGDSSLTEMCYAGLLYYPPQRYGLSCVD